MLAVMRRLPRTWPTVLQGPAPVLPRPLDAVAERWARLPPRVRTTVAVLALVALALLTQARVRAAESRWGGAPVRALVALEDLPVGAVPTALEARRLPPAAVPPGAVEAVPSGARLAFALPAGSVLTAAHLDPRGPAAGLPPDLRVLPVPVEPSWGVRRGGWVDVWVLGTDAAPARRVAQSRHVVDVRGDDTGATALVGLAVDEVAATTTGLALGRVVLAHAPPPADAAPSLDGGPPRPRSPPPAGAAPSPDARR